MSLAAVSHRTPISVLAARNLMHIDHRPAFSLESLPTYLTEDEVAAWLKTPIRTIIRMRYDRKGPPFIRLGLDYRYPMSGLLEWLDRKTK